MPLPDSWTARLALPLIAAPMTGVSGPELVIAACRGGVIGAFPTHNAHTGEELSRWLERIAGALPPASAPVAANLVVHRTNPRLQEDLDRLIEHRIELVIASVGSPAAIVEPLHAAGALVFADVATMRHVERALEVGVDGLILLTAGAGGQTGWLNPIAFVRAVRARYDGPVVLAGGIADGAALWAAQTLGVDLAYMGTKFIATHESAASEAYKGALVGAGPDQVELTSRASGLPTNLLVGRPEGADQANAGFDFQVLLSGRDSWSAGHSVCGVDELTDVATLIERTALQYAGARERTARALGLSAT
ncbi:MAG TPA: nitronate monooxygenase [Solirubrobacteraceae bacterium]|nr:nitronate monooxygenase [Solirubrobacteraceae bacterium]